MKSNNSCVILYSGGTDSTCTAALMAQKYANIHLSTFYLDKKPQNNLINKNINSLEKKFSRTKFIHQVIPTTKLVKFISYNIKPPRGWQPRAESRGMTLPMVK